MTGDTYPVSTEVAKIAHLTKQKYESLYEQSIREPEKFWGEQAKEFLTWIEPWEKVLSGSFDTHDVKWFQGGKLNACYNAIDRHLDKLADKPAIIWEGDDPSLSETLTYRELHEKVCRFANVLKSFGLKKGDKICIYLPMIPEVAIAMLAATRIGVVHSVVFAGFSTEALRTRIIDADCKLVITANESVRGNKTFPLKLHVDAALEDLQNVAHPTLGLSVIVIKRTEAPTPWNAKKDFWYHDLMATAKPDCPVEIMDALDPLFILYTSGSTGKPKGIVHSTAGYLLYSAITFKYVFNYRNQDIFWCSADVGWITGHTYGIYGPLLNGATTLMFEGIPMYPTPARFWEVIDKHSVNIFYTAPTAIRALRRAGDDWVKKTKRQSLVLLGTVGEPINPDAWIWYYNVVGEGKCPIVDTWWQTETGGMMITPIPGVMTLKPGSAAKPFFGIDPKIVDDNGNEVPTDVMGKLVITQPWPGMMETIYKDEARFNAYFDEFLNSPKSEETRLGGGYYSTGDQAHKDKEGYFWISGRSDDVIKVSGHRIGTEEVESAIVHHPAISEAAVVAIPDDIKGQSIYAFVTLKEGHESSKELEKEVLRTVREVLSPIAVPDRIQWVTELPKTRSGKIMRRILRKIANNDVGQLGDTSTLTDPTILEKLIKERELIK